MVSVLLLLTFVGQAAPAAPVVDPVRAKKVFDASCAGCHGPEGAGGKGPRLAVPKLRHARNDDELAQIITWGIPGTEMPASYYLGADVPVVMAYVKMLGANATPPKVTGDLAKGSALFHGKGACTGCHTVGSEGRAYGPDLSDIGALRSAAVIREKLVNPAASPEDNYIPVHATTRAGAKINGLRVNEDNFTIQILEPSGRLDSFRKSALTALDERPGETIMPSFKTLFSESEMQDLAAYLSSLRGGE